MRRQHLELRPEHLAAATSRQILLRMLANIFAIAEKTDPQLAEKLAGWIGSLRT
jgi:regulator of sirC expression with transglutaminase-like and TPR domain